jgi:hypothetical protein
MALQAPSMSLSTARSFVLLVGACLLWTSASDGASTSVFMTLDGSPVSPSEAHSVPLLKGVVDSKRRTELLLQLRFKQTGLSPEDEEDEGVSGSTVSLQRRRSFRNRAQRQRFASIDDAQPPPPAPLPPPPSDPLAAVALPHDRDSEPLQVQILSQKRLATYYGEIRIGGQAFKGAREIEAGPASIRFPLDCRLGLPPPSQCCLTRARASSGSLRRTAASSPSLQSAVQSTRGTMLRRRTASSVSRSLRSAC